MSKKCNRGWYNTGPNNTANPEIKYFINHDKPWSDFSCGPFRSFAEAKNDLLVRFRKDRDDAKWAIGYVRKLKRSLS